MECPNSLVLEANARIKLLEFMVSAIIGSDSTHIYFGVRIDVRKQILEISTHLSVNSGTYAIYRWPILQSTLQENRHLELPAKGLVSILNKVGVKEPVWLGLPNENEIYIAAYEETHPSQISLFEPATYTPTITNKAATRYSIQVIEHRKLNEYNFLFNGDECSFQVDAVTLCKELKVVDQLAKEGGDITSNDNDLILETKISESLNYISLYSRKSYWFATQDIDIQCDTQKGGCNSPLVHINLSNLSKLIGLLSQISGSVRIDICQSHLSLSRGQWLCAFRQTQPHWNGSNFANQFRSLGDEYFHSFSTHSLKETLKKLNVANDVKKARLHIKQHFKSDLTTLSLSQDHVHSSIDYPMPIPPNTLTTPVSLSLWSLISILDSTNGKVRWGFDTDNSRIIFTNDARRKYFVLQLQEE